MRFRLQLTTHLWRSARDVQIQTKVVSIHFLVFPNGKVQISCNLSSSRLNRKVWYNKFFCTSLYNFSCKNKYLSTCKHFSMSRSAYRRSIYIYIYIRVQVYLYGRYKYECLDEGFCLSSSSSSHTASTDLPDPLSPPVSIFNHSREVFHASSCIGTELLYRGSC